MPILTRAKSASRFLSQIVFHVGPVGDARIIIGGLAAAYYQLWLWTHTCFSTQLGKALTIMRLAITTLILLVIITVTAIFALPRP